MPSTPRPGRGVLLNRAVVRRSARAMTVAVTRSILLLTLLFVACESEREVRMRSADPTTGSIAASRSGAPVTVEAPQQEARFTAPAATVARPPKTPSRTEVRSDGAVQERRPALHREPVPAQTPPVEPVTSASTEKRKPLVSIPAPMSSKLEAIREPVRDGCTCPYDIRPDGSRCDAESKWTQASGMFPLCYATRWESFAAADPDGRSPEGQSLPLADLRRSIGE